MTTSEEPAKEVAAPAPEPQAAPDAKEDETNATAVGETEVVASNEAAEPTPEAPKKRGRKRKVSVTEDKAPAEGEPSAAAATEGAAGPTERSPKEKKPAAKKPKAAGKPAPATPMKRKVGRPRKIVKEVSESEDDIESELNRRVEALPDDVKAKFGTIVWAKMVGFPYWPALITDPRRLHPKFHAGAMKAIETKYFVCFYQSNDFSSVLFKNIEAWDNTKHDYRAGHPAKDAKAPKRRSSLMAAIELADKDAPLPIEERMDGLMKAVVEEAESAPEEEEKPVVVKRKPGRPVGSKNKPKPSRDAAATIEAASAAPKAKRGRKKAVEAKEDEGEDDDDSADKAPTPETPEEGDTEPPLSKDEIKAKVASRKTPSKKKAAAAEEKSFATAAKKLTKATAAKLEPAAKGELDSKRKKEIELVVPRKSVKSADIREATVEAARKKPGPREKPKDKGEYKVGNLTQFAGRMNRLFANESSKNNDELILLLTQLFEEKMVYRSDVERSGVAAVIAALRKSTNPTVATTASAVRKHLMRVLSDDVTEEASKKQKADAEADASKVAKKQKTGPAEPAAAAASESNGAAEKPEPVKVEVKADASEAQAQPMTPRDEPTPEVAQEEPTTETVADASMATGASDATTTQEQSPPAQQSPTAATPTSPVKVAEPLVVPVAAALPKPDPSGDKNRTTCIEMIKKSLADIGERSIDVAREIEAHLFERFSESEDEYRACARSITFGLKKHAHVRERLKNGDLHALELAYTPDEVLKS